MIMEKERCKQGVWNQGSWSKHQCQRFAWKDGYCKQHHPESVKARREESARRYQEKVKSSPWYLLEQANERIAELEAELASLKRDGD